MKKMIIFATVIALCASCKNTKSTTIDKVVDTTTVKVVMDTTVEVMDTTVAIDTIKVGE